MATATGQLVNREMMAQTGALIGVCTVALTATFLGIVGLASGTVGGTVDRLPLYVLAGAVVFVGTLLVEDHAGQRGHKVLGLAVVASLAGFTLTALGAEGIIYALKYPGDVVASHLFVYLLSAAIIASGLAYWSVENWREATALLDGRSL